MASSLTQWEPPDMSCDLHLKMTLHPTAQVPIADIISKSHYGATQFISAFGHFVMQCNNPQFTRQQIICSTKDFHLPFDTIPVYHTIKFWNEAIYGKETLDSIHIKPACIDNKNNLVAPARFDTALIQIRNPALEAVVDHPSLYSMFIFTILD